MTNTRGPKASSKPYLDQQSLPADPAQTGYTKSIRSQANPARGPILSVASPPGAGRGEGVAGGEVLSPCAVRSLGSSAGSWVSPQIQPGCGGRASLITACLL